ncbi:MAG: YtxH domain-containing protein [Bacteroidales bacterium]|nr:YtxH domain-containing protein [Bacteroidales bacterium]
MNSGKAFLGILVGTTAGALLGMLFAPQKGADARKKIAKTGKEYADTITSRLDKTLDGITKKFNKVKVDFSEIAQHSRAKAEKLKKESGVEIS